MDTDRRGSQSLSFYSSEIEDKSSQVNEGVREQTDTTSTDGIFSISPRSRSPTENYLRKLWNSVKSVTSKRRTSSTNSAPSTSNSGTGSDRIGRTFSVPSFLRRSPQASRARSRSQRRRAADEEDSKFGDALIGLMGRNDKYRNYLCNSTRQQIEKEVEKEQEEKRKSAPRRRSR
jgi:hypothetical protein